MDKENYIFLKAEDVHRQLITDIPSSLDEASELLDVKRIIYLGQV